MERVYLIKNPNTWMLDELIVFSQHVQFKVIFLRQPGAFYEDRLTQLRQNGIDIVVCPFSKAPNISKLLFCLRFSIRNLACFLSWYSFIVGIKSLWWFCLLEDQYFKKPVSIHAQFATQPALVSLLLSKYHSSSKIDYFFTFHAYDIFFYNRWFVKLVNNSRMCFSISEYNLNYVQEKYKGLDRSKLELSRLGAFASSQHHQAKASSEEFRIGFISWFVEKKGIQYLLEAMKIIAARNRNIKLVIAGDGPLRSSIEAYIASNNLGNSITYIGKLNEHEKASFFTSIDALVLPAVTLRNDKDGIPVVLMEAISFGLPIISTNISGIPEICINNYNGFLIPEKNVNALVNAITTLSSDRKTAHRYSENSYQLYSKYNLDTNSYSKLKKLEWIN